MSTSVLKFKVTDWVRLSIGGPTMAVFDVGNFANGHASTTVRCAWFNKRDNLKLAWFDEHLLEAVPHRPRQPSELPAH